MIAKAFDTSKDFVSDIKDIDNNRSILVNVDNIENEKPFELSQIFEIVSKDWIKSLKIKEINKFVENINLNSKSLEEIAKFVGSEILNSDIAINNSDYPSIFTNNLFKSKLKDISISEVGDDIYISKVIDITFPNEIENNVEKLSMISELRSKFRAEIIKTKKISTNDNLIQAILNQY